MADVKKLHLQLSSASPWTDLHFRCETPVYWWGGQGYTNGLPDALGGGYPCPSVTKVLPVPCHF